MAKSGRLYSGTLKNSKFYLAWQITNQSIENNYSDISWSAGLNISSYDEWYSNAVRINNVYINGTKVFNGGTYSNIIGNGDHELKSGTARIYHDSDGSKNFTASISGWLYSYGNTSGSKEFTLNSISRYAIISSANDFSDESNPIIGYSNPLR